MVGTQTKSQSTIKNAPPNMLVHSVSVCPCSDITLLVEDLLYESLQTTDKYNCAAARDLAKTLAFRRQNPLRIDEFQVFVIFHHFGRSREELFSGPAPAREKPRTSRLA